MSTNEIIEQIAKENGVSPDEVRADMQEALNIAKASVSPETENVWAQISSNGEEISIDEFLKYCINQITYSKPLC